MERAQKAKCHQNINFILKHCISTISESYSNSQSFQGKLFINGIHILSKSSTQWANPYVPYNYVMQFTTALNNNVQEHNQSLT